MLSTHLTKEIIKIFFTRYLLTPLLMLGVMSISYAQMLINRTQGDISFISGGLREDEFAAMKLFTKKWPLSIEFSEYLDGKDLWIAQVYLRILDSKKKPLFDTTIEGPLFLGKLPAGNYEILATYYGVTQSRKIQIIDGRSIHATIKWCVSKKRPDRRGILQPRAT